MNVINIRCFGHIEICVNGTRCECGLSGQTGNLIAALAVMNGQPIERSELANQLWPQLPEVRARGALSTELWRVRQLLKRLGFSTRSVILASKNELRFTPKSPHTVDIIQFIDLTKNLRSIGSQSISLEQLRALEFAATLYRGEFHHGYNEDWCLIRRHSFESRYLALLGVLMPANEALYRWSQAIHYADKMLSFDPLMESAYRCLMRCQFALGNKATSLLQFNLCKDTLRRELGVSPSSKTENLYRKILMTPDHEALASMPPLSLNNDVISAAAVDYIGSAIKDLDEARSRLVSISEKLRSN